MRDVQSAFKQVHATFEGKSWGFLDLAAELSAT